MVPVSVLASMSRRSWDGKVRAEVQTAAVKAAVPAHCEDPLGVTRGICIELGVP